MGTRNLTMVKDENGELKVAQYGQWDGFPEGQGATILRFISDKNCFDMLKEALPYCKFYNRCHDIDDFVEAYDELAPKWSNEHDKRTAEMVSWFDFFQSRDIGGDILQHIAITDREKLPKGHNGYIYLFDDHEFGQDSLMCEWAYMVDLQTNKFMVFEGFNQDKSKEHEMFVTNQEEVDERFSYADYRYYGIVLVKEYDLDNLPTEEQFIKDFSKDGEEE